MVLLFHWGKIIDTDEPTTGVIGIHDTHWLLDRIVMEGIDLDFEEYLADGGDPDYYEAQEPTMVLGFMKDEDGFYVENPDAEVSAILSGSNIQITHSKHMTKGTPCSPCYPGQCTIDAEGDCLCYAPAPDMYDEEFDEVPELYLVSAIFVTNQG